MKKYFLTFILFTIPILSQGNLVIEYDTTSTNDSIFIDLGLDLSQLESNYSGGDELRAIGFEMHGTWTNDSLQVYAASHPDSTYYPVYYAGAVFWEVATTGACYIALRRDIYAGIRYLLFKLPADEAANRLFGIIRRQY